MSKVTTLSHLKSCMEATKSYIDAADASLGARIDDVVADIEGIVATGGEANILEGMNVNGVALPITNKLVDLIIKAGTETGAINVNGVDVFVTGLGTLASMNVISENEIDDALKTSIAAKATNADLSALTVRVGNNETKITSLEEAVEVLQNAGYQTAEQVETIAKAAVAASGHASFKTAESDPTAEGFVAEDNVMYLWPAADGDGYTIYAKVGTEMKLLGHTKVDLSAYSDTEAMKAYVAEALTDYAKLTDFNAALDRITAVEEQFANYFTKDEAEAQFTNEAEAQAIAETAAAAAVEAAKASQEEVDTEIAKYFGSAT